MLILNAAELQIRLNGALCDDFSWKIWKYHNYCLTLHATERIIYVLKNMDILQRMPWAAQDSVFKKLSEIAEVASLNKEERQLYDESLRQYRDTIIVMEGQYLEGEKKGRAEGMAEGEKRGRAEGRAETLIQMAQKLKARGMAESEIAEMTGLSLDDIRNNLI